MSSWKAGLSPNYRQLVSVLTVFFFLSLHIEVSATADISISIVPYFLKVGSLISGNVRSRLFYVVDALSILDLAYKFFTGDNLSEVA